VQSPSLPPPLTVLATERCAECGKLMPPSELMPFSGFFVCPSCKPLAVSKISRGDPVGTIWREGGRLVMLRNGPFPERCVRCNEPAVGRGVKRTYYWHHPAIYLTLFIFPVVYLLVALIARKDSKVHVPLCAQHRKRRLIGILTCVGIFIGGFALCMGAMFALKGGVALTVGLGSVAVMLGSVIAGAIISPILRPFRMDDIYAFFKGAGSPFLEKLPPWPRR
jgi:hypothetical protein